MTLGNAAAVASGNTVLAVISPNANYDACVVISDVDLGSGGTNTLALGNVTATPTTVSQLRSSLAPGGSHNIDASVALTIPAQQCGSAKYLCVNVKEGQGASYVDAGTNNNWKCQDIQAQTRCKPSRLPLSF